MQCPGQPDGLVSTVTGATPEDVRMGFICRRRITRRSKGSSPASVSWW